MLINALPPRTPWNDFPDVLIHASESAVKQHPAYKAAKAGDGNAAIVLVNDTMSAAHNQHLLDLLRGHRPTLVSAHAYEREGVDAGVLQTNVVAHTGADGFARLARQAKFSGEIQAGAEYVLVDDFVGMGGTLANMKGYIESQGGRVLAAVCLTGKPHSAKLTPSPERLHELRAKHGTELENWWIGQFAHAFDALTESEARYLARTERSDTIRDRIAASE